MSTDDKASPVEGEVRAPNLDEWVDGCPFCGGDSIGLETTAQTQTGVLLGRGVCQDCGARGPVGQCSGKKPLCLEWADNWNRRDKTKLTEALKEIYAIRGEDAQVSEIVHRALNAL